MPLPTSGTLYLDSNIFIYSVERIAPYASQLEPLWEAAHRGDCVLLTSPLTLLETLVAPLRAGDQLLADLFRALLNSPEVELVGLSSSVFETAAQLRATHRLKTPDAIHLATALEHQADAILTNDPHFRRAQEQITIHLLSELG